MIPGIFRFRRKLLKRGRLVRSTGYRPLTEAMAAQAILRAMRVPWPRRLTEAVQAWWGRSVYPILHRWRAGAACPKCGARVWHRTWQWEPQTRRTCPARCEFSLGAPAEHTWQRSWQPAEHQPQWEDG